MGFQVWGSSLRCWKNYVKILITKLVRRKKKRERKEKDKSFVNRMDGIIFLKKRATFKRKEGKRDIILETFIFILQWKVFRKKGKLFFRSSVDFYPIQASIILSLANPSTFQKVQKVPSSPNMYFTCPIQKSRSLSSMKKQADYFNQFSFGLWQSS